MPARPKDPIEIVVRNLFLLQQASNSINDEVEEQLYELFMEIAAELVKADPAGPSLQRYRLQRVQKLIDAIQEHTGATFEEIARMVRLRLAELGRQQAGVATMHLQAILGAGADGQVETVRMTLNQVKAIVDRDPLQGVILKDWTAKQATDTAFKVRQQLQLGMTSAETIDDLVRRIRGRATGTPFRAADGRILGYRFTGGVLETTTREATALVRTAVNDVSNVAAFNTYAANDGITSEYEYTATLDSRTTLICASLDGRRFRYDDPKAKRPPQHWQCRSIIVPVVDWGRLGLTPPDAGTRASAGGQVSADTKYEDWLRAQPQSVQSEILGPSRARLFRDGKVSLREMVKSDGRRVRLDQLRPAA